MKKSKNFLFAVISVATTALLFATPQPAFAKDDFSKIVQHIETNYHVHRQHRFIMGVAGFTVKFWHIAGVKNFKGAIFENQHFVNASLDTRFDEVVRAAMDSGWQPLVQSYDRRSGERTYIYAQDLGKDLKVLVVNLESSEAVVLQVKVDPKKLNDFVQETMPDHRGHHVHGDEVQPLNNDKIEVAAATSQSWDGICLFAQEAETPVNNEL
jgi:hypothetical protein